MWHKNILSIGCSYGFHFLFNSRVKHGAKVGEVKDGQEAKKQVQKYHPIFLQNKRDSRIITITSFDISLFTKLTVDHNIKMRGKNVIHIFCCGTSYILMQSMAIIQACRVVSILFPNILQLKKHQIIFSFYWPFLSNANRLCLFSDENFLLKACCQNTEIKVTLARIILLIDFANSCRTLWHF